MRKKSKGKTAPPSAFAGVAATQKQDQNPSTAPPSGAAAPPAAASPSSSASPPADDTPEARKREAQAWIAAWRAKSGKK